MSNSIEKIWQEGFLRDDALVAPKINNLYDKKSIHVIDQFKRIFRINLIAIVTASIVILVASLFFGVPFAGITVFILLNWLVLIGKKEIHALRAIDKSASSYLYLTSFDKWMKNQIATYTRAYTYVYPLLFLSLVVGISESGLGVTIVSDLLVAFPNSTVVFGIPVFLIAIIGVLTAVIAYYGGALYRLDLDLIYGNVNRKLGSIIEDMEELRAS